MITKKQNSKLIAALLSVIMVVAFMPQMAFAEGNDTWSSITANGVTVSVSTTTELLTISGSGNQYQITSTQSGYFPKHFSMKVEPNAEVTATNGAKFEYYNAPYGVVTMGEAAATLTVGSGQNSFTIDCPAPNGGSSAGAGLEAYLPGYGQFANEGINSGGWGDGYVDQTTGKKAMVNAMAQTGLSLGSFGGYAVLKFDTPVENSPNNPYGIDFILYGNAFSGNAEPGCVQVSQDGSTWYDIAGSKHYADDTVWNCEATYTNPTITDDNIQTAPALGTFPTEDHTYVLENIARPGELMQTETVNVNHNTWHQHSWFPLFANYFKIRKAGDTSLANPIYDFVTRDTVANTLKLKGTKIKFDGPTADKYQFGYCDVHSNGNNYGTAVNPYTMAANGSGGDGIDISWAVNGNGEPVNLANISYVRVYTGVANMAGIFGETSTELCGAYAVTPEDEEVEVKTAAKVKDGSNTHSAVSVNGSRTQGKTNITQTANEETYTVVDAIVGEVSLNGVSVFGEVGNPTNIANGVVAYKDGTTLKIKVTLNAGQTRYLQLITYDQNPDNKEAYVNLVKVTR